jgi:hypothetical protein
MPLLQPESTLALEYTVASQALGVRPYSQVRSFLRIESKVFENVIITSNHSDLFSFASGPVDTFLSLDNVADRFGLPCRRYSWFHSCQEFCGNQYSNSAVWIQR